jgi:Putative Flp pilus-assembly TadE/G-like
MLPQKDQRGFVMVTMVASSAVLLACIGLGIDAGCLELLKSRMQTAADAAALGGSQEYRMNGPAGVTGAAQGDSALNGFTNGVNGVTVTVHNPPTSGYSIGDPTAVEAIVTQQAATFFMSTLGFSTVTVSARSVAKQGASSTCVYVLSPNAAPAISVTNGVGVTSACGVMVDSSDSTQALLANGGAQLTAPSIGVVGGYTINNGAKVSPLPSKAAAAIDPFASIQPPAVGACLQNNYQIQGNTVVSPPSGTYCNGITIGNSARVTLSGTYVLLGGGLNWGGGATVTGSGVTIYNTWDPTHTYKPITISNGVSVTLSAPTSGGLAGILMFQDRSVASGVGADFAGGATLNLTGALYFPTTSLNYSNGVSAPYNILVAKTISFSGGVKIDSDYSSLPAGSPAKGGAALSE